MNYFMTKIKEVCATCFTNNVNTMWECECSYWTWRILEIDKNTLDKIYYLQDKWFKISLQNARQVLKCD
jgi:hypothetical protein